MAKTPKADGAQRGGLKPRLSLPIDPETGAIAVDALSEKVRRRLSVALAADPSLRGRVEGGADLPAPEAPAAAAPDAGGGFPLEIGGIVYEALGRVLQLVARRQGHSAQAVAVLTFTEDDKKLLAPPTCRLLDKYFPGGLSKYGDEAALALLLLATVQAKWSQLPAVPAAPAASGALPFRQANAPSAASVNT